MRLASASVVFVMISAAFEVKPEWSKQWSMLSFLLKPQTSMAVLAMQESSERLDQLLIICDLTLHCAGTEPRAAQATCILAYHLRRLACLPDVKGMATCWHELLLVASKFVCIPGSNPCRERSGFVACMIFWPRNLTLATDR